jgi:O-antigen/teichoic acid export membrane protein
MTDGGTEAKKSQRASRGEWMPSDHATAKGGLQGRVARGLTWTIVDTWGSQLLALIVFVLLARLLTQVDFGVVATAAIFVSFAGLLVDQGLGDAVIQRQTLTRRQLDTAFWASMLTGVVLAVAAIVLAIPIAALLGQPLLQPIIQVLSITFVLSGLASIQTDLLRREMAFGSLAIRRIAAVIVGGIVGVGMALAGYGAWSLVGQQIAAALASVVMLWTVTPWRPSRQFSREDFGELFGFGIRVVGGDVLNWVSRNIDNLLVVVFLGVVPVALYTVAYRILDTSQTLLVNAARKLIFPTFSRLQHDPERIRRAYSRINRASSALTLPGYIGLALVAPEATVTLFGDKWADSGPVAAVLFLIGPVLTLQAFSGALFNAVGRPDVTLRFRLVTTITNVVGFLIAVLIFRDILAVAAAFAIRGYLLLPLNLLWMRQYGHINIREHLLELRGVVIATAVMAGAVLLVKFVLAGHVDDGVLLLAEIVVGLVVFGLALFVVERPLVADIVSIAAQGMPGGVRIARLLHLPMASTGGRKARATLDTSVEAEIAAGAVVDPTGLANEDPEQPQVP